MKEKEVKKWDAYDVDGIGVGGYTDTPLLESYAHGRVLELGCGRGRLLGSLEKVPAGDRYGIDLSERAIEAAETHYPGIHFSVGDVCNVAFPDASFDFIYSIEVIEHIAEPERMLAEIHRLLKPGGYGFIQTPNYPAKRVYDVLYWLQGKKKTWRDDYTHVSKFPAKTLANLIARYFSIVQASVRNIMLENRISLLKKMRETRSGGSFVIGQKTIVVFWKEE